MALSAGDLMLIEQRITNDGTSVGVTYLLWFFLGMIGVHRFFLGRVGTGVLMIVTFGGLGVWWFIDAFLIPGMIKQKNEALRQKLMIEYLARPAA